MEGFEIIRQNLLNRIKPLLADAVASLLVVAYEPRDQTEKRSDEFDDLVKRNQALIQDAMKDLTVRDGGALELLGLNAAKELHENALKNGHYKSAAILSEAIRQRGEVKSKKQTLRADLPAVTRVTSQSGKPIGLWR